MSNTQAQHELPRLVDIEYECISTTCNFHFFTMLFILSLIFASKSTPFTTVIYLIMICRWFGQACKPLSISICWLRLTMAKRRATFPPSFLGEMGTQTGLTCEELLGCTASSEHPHPGEMLRQHWKCSSHLLTGERDANLARERMKELFFLLLLNAMMMWIKSVHPLL